MYGKISASTGPADALCRPDVWCNLGPPSVQVDSEAPPAPEKAPAPSSTAATPAAPKDAQMFDAVDDELALALQLSMQDSVEGSGGGGASGSGVDAGQAIEGLPGVDPANPAVRAAMQGLKKEDEKKGGEEEGGKKPGDKK